MARDRQVGASSVQDFLNLSSIGSEEYDDDFCYAYRAAKGDAIDQEMAKFLNSHEFGKTFCLPVIRLQVAGGYLIGTLKY